MAEGLTNKITALDWSMGTDAGAWILILSNLIACWQQHLRRTASRCYFELELKHRCVAIQSRNRTTSIEKATRYHYNDSTSMRE